MNSDTASNASGETTRTGATTASATSFQNRPILHPTPPSTRQLSPSPTRKVLSQLKLATPSLRVCQPDVRLEQPPSVRRLGSMLITRLSSEVIPYSLEVVVFSFNSSCPWLIQCRLDSEPQIPTRLKVSMHSERMPSFRRSYGRPPSLIHRCPLADDRQDIQ